VAAEWPLVGRDGDLAAVDAALDDPDLSGVVVVGAHGVGKTRLATEVRRRAQAAGRPIAWATATQAARGIPFGALAHLLPHEQTVSGDGLDLLRHPGPAVATMVGEGPASAYLPIVVVDDAHLLDDASITFLHHLVLRKLVALVLTVRVGEPWPDPITALWKDGLVERLGLRPLDRTMVTAVLHAALGGQVDPITSRRIWQLTGGAPLFVREVLHAARVDGALARRRDVWRWDGALKPTERLTELMEARLLATDQRCRPVVEQIACGEPVPAWLADRLLDGAGLELAQSARLVETDDTGDEACFRLAHPLYGALLRATVPASRRRRYLTRLADALLRHGLRGADDLLRVAVWTLDAGASPRDAGVSFPAAARQALMCDDPQLAERLARAAVDVQAPDALAILADALEKQGRHVEVLELLAQAPEPKDSAALAIARASNSYWGGEGAPAAHTLLSEPPAEDRPVGSGEVLATEAWLLLFDSRLTDCIAAARSVIERGVEDVALVWAATAGATAMGLSGLCDDALAVADKGRETADTLAAVHRWGVPQVMWARVLALVSAGRLTEARSLVDADDRHAADGSPQLVGMWSGFRGLVAKLQGDTATALVNLRAAVSLLEDGDMYGFTQLWLAELAAAAALAGDAAGARRTLEDAVARDSDANRIFEPWIALDAAWVLVAEGRVGAAVDQALAAADRARDAEQRAFEVIAAFDVARLGRPELVNERLADLAARVEGPLAALCAQASEALRSRDVRRLVASARDAERLGGYLLAAELATTAAAYGSAVSGPGAAAHIAERARRLRQRSDGAATPLLATVSAHFALTHREREIAELAAAGRTSPEIGRTLHISARTVDNHLGRVYSKLGVNGRSALAPIFDRA
jgi:DNA-binding CsgD family transcriptional regulator